MEAQTAPRPRRPARRAVGFAALAVTIAIVLAACGAVLGGGSLSEPPDEVEEGQVPMQTFSDPTGSTLLLVPVWFGDAGPFQFILDTGASRTVLDPTLAEELGLAEGAATRGRGVVAEFQGALIDVESWRVGDVELQPRTVVSAELPEAPQGPEFRGLLGSDVMAGFGVIEIDYDNRVLTLRSGE